MLQEVHLPPSFWGEALHTLVYTLNHTPCSANPGITLYEAFFGVKPDVSSATSRMHPVSRVIHRGFTTFKTSRRPCTAQEAGHTCS